MSFQYMERGFRLTTRVVLYCFRHKATCLKSCEIFKARTKEMDIKSEEVSCHEEICKGVDVRFIEC